MDTLEHQRLRVIIKTGLGMETLEHLSIPLKWSV